jgi:hypothetical protein
VKTIQTYFHTIQPYFYTNTTSLTYVFIPEKASKVVSTLVIVLITLGFFLYCHDYYSFGSVYRIQIRGKKWWWPIFSNFLDVAASNAWKIYKAVHLDDDMAQLTFRRLIAVNFIHSSTTLSNLLGRHGALLNNPRPGPVHLMIRNENRDDVVHVNHRLFLCVIFVLKKN